MTTENNTVEQVESNNVATTENVEQVNVDNTIGAEHESLKKLPVEDLVSIISETRSEAKKRRLENKELKETLVGYKTEQEKAEEEALKKNNEWQGLYEKRLEETKDYDDLKQFKAEQLEIAKDKVEQNKNNLTKAELEIFDLASKNMTYTEQKEYISKLLENRSPSITVDNTQSIARTNKDKETKKNPLRPGDQDPVLAGLRSARN